MGRPDALLTRAPEALNHKNLAERYFAINEFKEKSTATQRTYKLAIGHYIDFLSSNKSRDSRFKKPDQASAVAFADTVKFPNTRLQSLIAVNGFLHYSQEILGYTERETIVEDEIKKLRKQVRTTRNSKVLLTNDEVDKLKSAAEKSTTANALIRLALTCDAKRGELIKLHSSQIIESGQPEGAFSIRFAPNRISTVEGKDAQAISDLLETNPNGYLFRSPHLKNGEQVPVTRSAVCRTIKRYREVLNRPDLTLGLLTESGKHNRSSRTQKES